MYVHPMKNALVQLTGRITDRIGVEPGNFIGVCLAVFSGLPTPAETN